jgi:putative membrane protein
VKLKALVLIAALAIPAPALAQQPQPPPTDDAANKAGDKPASADKSKPTDKSVKKTKLSDEEKAIVAHMHHVNVMEIDLGKVAQKSGTAAVKRYGETMVRDHSAADKDVVSLAKRHGIAKIPADTPKTEVEQQERKQMMDDVAKLKKLKGADFDREYLRMMVDDHERELAKSDVALATAMDAELKQLIETTKPMLQRHADAARDLQRGNAQASAAPTTPAPNAPKQP